MSIIYDAKRSAEEEVTTYTVKDFNGLEIAWIHTEKNMDVTLVTRTSMFVHTNKKLITKK